MNPALAILVLTALALLWQRREGRPESTPAPGGDPGSGPAGGPATGLGCVALESSINGQFVAAELGDPPDFRLTVNRSAIGPWESFTVAVVPGDGRMSIQASHGRYVAAEGGGGGPLHANRTAPGAWEKFELIPAGASGVYVKTYDGRYWRQDGGDLVADGTTATRTAFRLPAVNCPDISTPIDTSGPIDPGPLPGSSPLPGFPNVPDASDTVGVVTASGRAVAVNGAPWLAIGATFFPAAWAWRNDRDRLRANLAYLAARGVDYIRCLAQVGPGQGWEDRTIDPRDPLWQASIAGVLEEAAAVGLRVQWTIFGNLDLSPTAAERRSVVVRVLDVARTYPTTIFAIEIANEPFGTGWTDLAELRALAFVARSTSPFLVALGAAPTEAESSSWNLDGPANALVVHLDRSQSGTCGMWRPARQPWEVQFYPSVPGLWLNNEPIGPQSSVNPDDDPWRLTAHAAVTWLAGGAAFVFHAGPGIRFGGAEDRRRGRAANFDELPAIDVALRGIATVRGVLPPDAPNWNPQNAHWPGYPFESGPIVAAQAADTLCRAYAITQGRTAFTIPIAIGAAIPFVPKAPMQIDAIDLLSGQLVEAVFRQAGDPYVVDPSRGPAIVLRSETS